MRLHIRPSWVVATHREMCLRRRRQVGRDRRSSREADARAHATKSRDRETEFVMSAMRREHNEDADDLF